MSDQRQPQNFSTEAVPGLGSATPRTNAESTADSPFRDRIVTIPNILCAFRLVGSIALFGIALTGSPRLFTGVFIVLSLSDWIDGKLARWLNQRSVFGARFDSVADAVLYSALFFGIAWLRWDVLQSEAPWWIAAFLSYVLTISAGLWKYGKAPSYHTYAAKFCYWLILVGGICLLLAYSVWPFRIAMAGVTLTNVETMVITWHLKAWRADVLTVFHVFPGRIDPGISEPKS